MQFIPFMIVALALIWLWEKAPWLVMLAILGIAGAVFYGFRSAAENKRIAQKKLEDLTTVFYEGSFTVSC